MKSIKNALPQTSEARRDKVSDYKDGKRHECPLIAVLSMSLCQLCSATVSAILNSQFMNIDTKEDNNTTPHKLRIWTWDVGGEEYLIIIAMRE